MTDVEMVAPREHEPEANNADNPSALININISGTLFHCTSSMFKKFPLSRLANLPSHPENFNEETNEYRFDTDPVIFNFILDAYRTGVIHAPSGACAERFRQDLAFWCLPISHVSPCCWRSLHSSKHSLYLVNMVTDAILNSVDVGSSPDGQLTTKQKIWLMIEKPNSSKMAWTWASVAGLVVFVATMLLFAISLPSTYESHIKSHTVLWTERLCYLFLTTEMIGCLVTCPNISCLLRNWMHWVEALSCVAFWVTALLEVAFSVRSFELAKMYIVVKYLTVLRVTRLLRAVSNIKEFRIICLTMRRSIWNCVVFLLMLSIVTMIFGSLLFLTSIFSEYSQLPNAFLSLYMAIITATTVGYGDLIPTTAAGNFMAAFCAVSGIVCCVLFLGGIILKYYDTSKCYEAVKSQIEEMQNMVPEGEKIRLRTNDPTLLVKLEGCTYSFKLQTLPTVGATSYSPVTQNATA